MFQTYRVIDADIVATTASRALAEIMDRSDALNGGYACFVNAHVSVMSRQRSDVKAAVESSTFAFPDGIPVYFVGKYLQNQDIEKISGPDFMALMFDSERGRKLRHYFYGGKPEVLEALVSTLNNRYPNCNIVGAVSPPFRQLSEAEHEAELAAIRYCNAQIVWVGLGAPKQELWMQANTGSLPLAMLMGVGAAFDFHAGTIERAPEWIQRWGLEWLHRLLQEPGRLWKRYLMTNSLFIYFALKSHLGSLLKSKS
jgi:N-acetylglucosaminyldiphosphoundecaprenol N-acetyl-beta-D-mannosaminyltransferase